jgi:arginine N-succinyltransferase
MAQGKSEFWEAMGRRFTGLPYQEADKLSHKYKEFIHSLFPKEEIYTCVLSSAARFVLGRVGDETRPAQHLLETLGFKYLNEVDPFDGGPHFGVLTQDVPLIKDTKHAEVSSLDQAEFKNFGLVGLMKDKKFSAKYTAYRLDGDCIVLPGPTKEILKLNSGDKVFVTEIS